MRSPVMVVALALGISLAACSSHDSSTQRRYQGVTAVWDLVDGLVLGVPHTVAGVMGLTGSQMHQVTLGYPRYESNDPSWTPEGLEVTEVAMAVDTSAGWRFTYVGVKPGECVTRDDTRKRYPDAREGGRSLADNPVRTVSLHRTVNKTDVSLVFLDDTGCLTAIATEPVNPPMAPSSTAP